MDAAAAAPQAGYNALVRQLSRQLSLSSESDDAPVNLADLPGELLALILYRLLLAHDIAQLAPLCSALRDAAQLVFIARPYSRDVLTLAGHTNLVQCVAAADDGHVLTGSKDNPSRCGAATSSCAPSRRTQASSGSWRWRCCRAARASSAAAGST